MFSPVAKSNIRNILAYNIHRSLVSLYIYTVYFLARLGNRGVERVDVIEREEGDKGRER